VNDLLIQKEMEKENISKTLSSTVQKLHKLEKNQHYQATYRLRKKLGLVKRKEGCGRPRVVQSMTEFSQNIESMY
jgi:transcriptional regulator of NAD metabolism